MSKELKKMDAETRNLVNTALSNAVKSLKEEILDPCMSKNKKN